MQGKEAGALPLSLEEAAAYLRISKLTMGKLLREGKVKGAKAGKEWRIMPSALHEFLTSSNQKQAGNG